ncbi:response regulator [Ohtaekwangia sp.]|uniref:response regulator n=1 Tax=Ohtaekwangia sp. TaxID=2066019 RepID=UPI002F944795
MTILYAEDDIDDFLFFCEVIETIDPTIQCVNATTGIEALEMLDRIDTLPDFIFIDINMPAMDGKACLKDIKNDPRLKSIPVIIYSTSNSPMDIEQCMQLGAAAYLVKPHSFDDIVASLSKIVTGKLRNDNAHSDITNVAGNNK